MPYTPGWSANYPKPRPISPYAKVDLSMINGHIDGLTRELLKLSDNELDQLVAKGDLPASFALFPKTIRKAGLMKSYGHYEYAPSTRLYKVNKHKLVKNEWLHNDVGVVERRGRSLEWMNAMVASKNTSRVRYEVRELWIGWTRMGVVITDEWMIEHYGLLAGNLSDA